MQGDDILSVIFLTLICIIVSAIVMKLTPGNSNLIVPSFAVICVGMWIAYDYMTISRNVVRKKHRREKNNADEIQELVDDINQQSSMGGSYEDNGQDSEQDEDKEPTPKKQNDSEFDIDMYNGNGDIRKIYQEMSNSGDTQLANRMKYIGMQPKLSKDIRANWNKHGLLPYVEAELAEGEAKHWYGNDTDETYGPM